MGKKKWHGLSHPNRRCIWSLWWTHKTERLCVYVSLCWRIVCRLTSFERLHSLFLSRHINTHTLFDVKCKLSNYFGEKEAKSSYTHAHTVLNTYNICVWGANRDLTNDWINMTNAKDAKWVKHEIRSHIEISDGRVSVCVCIEKKGVMPSTWVCVCLSFYVKSLQIKRQILCKGIKSSENIRAK